MGLRVRRNGLNCRVLQDARGNNLEINDVMIHSLLMPVCDTMKRPSPGAQTERRSLAGPVRDLLGGKTSPADFLSPQRHEKPKTAHQFKGFLFVSFALLRLVFLKV
jgi:hypothetical protein